MEPTPAARLRHFLGRNLGAEHVAALACQRLQHIRSHIQGQVAKICRSTVLLVLCVALLVASLVLLAQFGLGIVCLHAENGVFFEGLQSRSAQTEEGKRSGRSDSQRYLDYSSRGVIALIMNDHGRRERLLAVEVQGMDLGYWAQRPKQIDGFLSSSFGARELVHNITSYETRQSVKHVHETGSGGGAYSEQ